MRNKIITNYPKEKQAFELWKDWYHWLLELGQHSAVEQIMEELQNAFWMMQEYRISVFSPGVKVVGSVSTKRLQKLLEELEQQLELL